MSLARKKNPNKTGRGRSVKIKRGIKGFFDQKVPGAGPKYPMAGSGVNLGIREPSLVLAYTLLPHQVWMLVAPIVPFLGYWRMKKMRTEDTATPESRAADKT